MKSKKRPGRMRRWAARLSAATAVLIVVFVAVAFRPVDRADWKRSDSMKRANEIVSAIPARLDAAEESVLEAGWASVPLTAKVGEPLAGYAAREGAPSVGEGETMWARALCLRTETSEVIFVTADILLVHHGVADAVVEICSLQGIDPESLYFTATHTHSGPGGWGPNIIEEAVCGEYDPAIVKRLAGELADVIIEAREAVVPAEWAWLRTEAPEFLRNRTVDDGLIDPVLEAVAIRRKEDGAVGLFAFYGAHATSVGADRMTCHADYPGVFVREVEKAGIAFAAFGSASVGSQAPDGPGEGEQRAVAIGKGLAGKILGQLQTAEWKSHAAVATVRKSIPLPDFQIRMTNNIRVAQWIANGIHPTTAPIHFVRINQHRIVGLPVEFSSMLSTPLRNEAKTHGLELTPTVFNGDYVGYVLPVEIYDSGAYETQMNFLGPGGGAWFSELVRVGVGIE